MDFTGKLANVTKDWQTNQFHITFTVNEESAINAVNDIKDCEKLSITAKKYRKKRSLDANGMLWSCISEIAAALRADKWDIYLQMLKRYGQYTYICVKPKMVEAVKMQWRECEVVGNVNINGQEAVQMLVYFGSSTYNTQEFSVLLDGVVSEMKEMGLPLPMPGDMKKALEQWEKMQKGKNCNE